MKKLILLLFVFVSTMVFANGNDVIGLKNQMKFCGTVIEITDSSALFSVDKELYEIPISDISFIGLEDSNTTVSQSLLEAFAEDPNTCVLGQMDAEMYHGKKGGAFALGVLFGPFAIIGYALTTPTPEKGKNTMMLSANTQYFSDVQYLSCYKKKAKSQTVGAAALGWATWILLLLVL